MKSIIDQLREGVDGGECMTNMHNMLNEAEQEMKNLKEQRDHFLMRAGDGGYYPAATLEEGLEDMRRTNTKKAQ